MTPTATTTKIKRYRLHLKAGFHVEDNHLGQSIYYKQGDIFLAKLPMHRKWPEKFERVESFVPLRGGELRLAEVGEATDKEENESADDCEYVDITSPQKQGIVDTQMEGASNSLHTTNASKMSEAPYPPKEPPSAPPIDDEILGSMTVNELKSYAEEEEIDLKGATRKEDILRIIRQGKSTAN